MSHEPKPQERCLELGPNALTDTELLAVLLSDSWPADDAKEEANRILKDANGLVGLLAFEGVPGELEKLGSLPVATLLAAIELSRRLARVAVPEQPLNDRRALANFVFQRYHVMDQEIFGAVYVDMGRRWIADRVIFRGLMGRAVVEPQPVLRHALALGASFVIIFHTHPRGSEQPSPQDREFSKRMIEAAGVMGLGVLDHLVIGSNGSWASAMPRRR